MAAVLLMADGWPREVYSGLVFFWVDRPSPLNPLDCLGEPCETQRHRRKSFPGNGTSDDVSPFGRRIGDIDTRRCGMSQLLFFQEVM